MKPEANPVAAICDRRDTALNPDGGHRPPLQNLSRREFFKASALAGGGFALSYYLSPVAALAQSTAVDNTARVFVPNAFIRIYPDGTVKLMAKTPDSGQGVKTALPMIIAEEMDVEIDKVIIEQADFDPIYGGQAAGGSRTIPSSYEPMRRAGAIARTMLISAAAQHWGVPADELATENGAVLHPPTSRAITYGELALKAALLPVPDASSVKLKDPSQFKIIGSRIGGVDNPSLVTGQPLFGIDMKLPGMLYAVYERCPTFGGNPVSANLERIKALPGVRDAFIVERAGGLQPGVAIIADTTWAAFSARRQLQVVWDEGDPSAQSSTAYDAAAAALARKPGTVVRNDGDVDAAFAGAKAVIESAYSYPYISHATLEPQNCTAWFKGDQLEIWAPTQNPGGQLDQIVAVAGLPKERIKIHVTRSGGGFGRRLINDYSVEAAAIAKQAKVPIKLTWSREDDMRHDLYRPCGWHFLKGSVDAQGKLSGWKNHFVTVGFKGTEAPASSAGLSPDELPARFLANYRLEQSIQSTIVPTGPLRAPGSNALAFTFQGFIDELAHAAGRDPLEFRLELLGDDRLVPGTGNRGTPYNSARMKAVLRKVGEISGWGKTQFPKGRGLGVAFHFSHSGYVAQVADVSVAQDGTLKVHQVWCAVDVGPIINRSGAENQVQGSIGDGLGAAWLQEITIERGRVMQSNFADYPLLRINDMPKVEIAFIESQNPPTGLGEPPYPVTPPAICNAIFAATGKRIRTLPITKTDLRWSY